MHRIRTIIIEDEPLARKRLESMIKKVGHLEILGSYENPEDAVEILQSGNVDLMISDIQMPEIDGLSFLRSLPEPPLVIFITGHKEFAIEGFELNVSDYILKPLLTETRLIKAIDKVQNTILSQRNEIKNLKLKFKNGHKTILVSPLDIMYAKAFGDYVKLVTVDETNTVSSTLKEMEKKLPWKSFIRVHRSYIVNIEQVKSVDATTLKLKNGEKLEIGLQYRNQLFSRIGLA